MLIHPSMLFSAADEAGMKRPSSIDDDADEPFDRNEYPHFAVFCALQLCRPMQPGEHWENAKIIAEMTENQVKNLTYPRAQELGLTG